MESKNLSLGVVIPCILAVLFFGFAACDIEKDREKCASQLVGLATCLPYVSGEAKAPPTDCCTGFKQVLKDSRECICLLIKDRNDPSLGLKINATLALSLPTRCNAPTNQSVADCPGNFTCIYQICVLIIQQLIYPLLDFLNIDYILSYIGEEISKLFPLMNGCNTALLHLPPNSPDAKVFEDFANSGNKSNTTTAPASGNSSSGTTSTTTDQKSDGGEKKRWLGTQMVSGMLLTMATVHILTNLQCSISTILSFVDSSFFFLIKKRNNV